MSEEDLKIRRSAEEKVKKIQFHPLIILITSKDIGSVLRPFCSLSSVLPICSLFHQKLTQRFREVMFERKAFRSSLLESIENIHLFLWYKWLRKRLRFKKKGIVCYPFPYVEGTSKAEADLYFQWKGMSKQWRKVKRGGYLPEFDGEGINNSYTCLPWLAESYGYISLDLVPVTHYNILDTIHYNRWEITDKYMERGDFKGRVGDIIDMISHGELRKFIRRYNVQREIYESNDNYSEELIEILLYDGILVKKDIPKTGYSPYLCDKEKRSCIPMNVLEDLFTLHAGVAREGKGICTRKECIYTLQEIFFDDLVRGDRKINPMASKRFHVNAEVEKIINTLRGDKTPLEAGSSLASSVHEASSVSNRTMAIIMLSLYVGGEATPAQRACVSLIGIIAKEIMTGMNRRHPNQRDEGKNGEDQ